VLSLTTPEETASMITVNVNDQDRTVDVPADMPLLWVLRDVIGLTGTKFGCGIAQCGACTVHVDGLAVRSCVLSVGSLAGRKVTTVETVGETPAGKRIQEAWLEIEVVQCGYCQSGQVMSAAALLTRNPNPTDDDIDAAMAGNICRCGTYARIREAIKLAATAPPPCIPFPSEKTPGGFLSMHLPFRLCWNESPRNWWTPLLSSRGERRGVE